MNISDYLSTALLNHSLDVAVFTPPSRIWAGLYTVAPVSSSGGGTEVVASDYVRVQTGWLVGSVGSTVNAADIRFPSSGFTLSNWGTVVALGLWDAPTSGNLFYFGPLSAAVSLTLGSDFKISANNLTITIS